MAGSRPAMGAVVAGSCRWAGLRVMVRSPPRVGRAVGRAVGAGSRWAGLRAVVGSCRRVAVVHVAQRCSRRARLRAAGHAVVASNRLRVGAAVVGSPVTGEAGRSRRGDKMAAGTGLTNPLAQPDR